MEHGVDEALRSVCAAHGLDWADLLPRMRAAGRYHIETY
jgi:benzoyl-CoA 2,3-dioxygenase component A